MAGGRFQEPEAVFRQYGGILRMSEAVDAGIPRKTLYAMRDAGVIDQLSRGLYRLASLPVLEAPDLVTVSQRVPHGVICLISALAFHELTTQIPHAVDVAVIRGTEKPRVDYPPVNIYWFSEAPFEAGIERYAIDGVEIDVYGPEKSVADVFKYRNKLGLDVALEALKMWRERPGIRFETLLEFARVCRVERVMRPYLEALA